MLIFRHIGLKIPIRHMIGFSRAPTEMLHFCTETGGYISRPFGYFYLSYRAENLGCPRATSRLASLKFSRSNSNPIPVFWSHFDLTIWNFGWAKISKSKMLIEKSIQNLQKNKTFRGEIFDFCLKLLYWLFNENFPFWKYFLKKLDKFRRNFFSTRKK